MAALLPNEEVRSAEDSKIPCGAWNHWGSSAALKKQPQFKQSQQTHNTAGNHSLKMTRVRDITPRPRVQGQPEIHGKTQSHKNQK